MRFGLCLLPCRDGGELVQTGVWARLFRGPAALGKLRHTVSCLCLAQVRNIVGTWRAGLEDTASLLSVTARPTQSVATVLQFAYTTLIWQGCNLVSLIVKDTYIMLQQNYNSYWASDSIHSIHKVFIFSLLFMRTNYYIYCDSQTKMAQHSIHSVQSLCNCLNV